MEEMQITPPTQATSLPPATFCTLLTTISAKGFLLSELKEFSTTYHPQRYRAWLNNRRLPSHVHGVGWGDSPLLALQAALVAFDKEALKERAQPPRLLTLKDLGL